MGNLIVIQINLLFKNFKHMQKDVSKIIKIRDKVISDISVTLEKVRSMGLQEQDWILINSMLNELSRCYEININDYLFHFERNFKRKFDVITDYRDEEYKEPSLSDCVKRLGVSYRNSDINILPSQSVGTCCSQCLVISSGDWEFGDTKMRNDILSYWYRCFYKNRFTIIFSESWQSNSWTKWKGMIDSFVAEQVYEINGEFEDVNHAVVIIEYSDDMVHLRYHEKSI